MNMQIAPLPKKGSEIMSRIRSCFDELPRKSSLDQNCSGHVNSCVTMKIKKSTMGWLN